MGMFDEIGLNIKVEGGLMKVVKGPVRSLSKAVSLAQRAEE